MAKRRSVKDPKTGRRVTRANLENEWTVVEVPTLRILDDELFDKVRSRRLEAGTPASRRRPKSQRLLSGLLRCGNCGSGMALCGSDRSGPRILCSRHRESGACENGSKYYIERIERLVLDRLKTQIGNRKLMDEYVEAYVAERRALSANARRDSLKLHAKIETCQRSIERMISAIEDGTLEAAEVASRLTAQRAEKARLQHELSSADSVIASVDLHPTAIRRFEENLARISVAGNQIDNETTSSFRELVASVVVMPRSAGDPYVIEIKGRLSALIGGPAKMSAREVVPVERIELPTFGLQTPGSSNAAAARLVSH
jgi:site-specific DNA recombinase